MRKELPKVYDPREVEPHIYQMWMDNGCFKADADPKKKPFSIVMPPPNVTGQLHMGHAMDSTLQDILTRFKRMQGYSALWLPGTDHAGIATQIKVEERLREEEHLTRYDLGREKFLERVWAWKEKYGNRIVEQQKKMGASCDWSRSRFTMDEGCSQAVREAFCELYDKGLIYKGSRIINWCPHCLTALSDAEVERVCESIRAIREQVGIEVCVSFGLLNEEQFKKIREAGATRAHCNLESSGRYFKEICTTHTYQQKIDTLNAAKRAGLSVCSGGIMGLGETMEDRIEMVLTARELGVKSIPVNVLNPIPGTPYEHNRILTNDEVCRCVAIFRFLIPDASIRLAGGRGLLGDKGEACFRSGANAAISGDMLTTSGINMETDMELLKTLGYEVRLYNG